MESLAPTLLTFALGLIIGGVLAFLLSPARRDSKRLQRERDDALSNLEKYRSDVDQHFMRTAELVNNMTESYRAVHDHLATGARGLCSEQGRRLAVARSLDSLPDKPVTETPVTPPLDYAPSTQGTLSEDYGLRKAYHAEGPFTPVDDLLNAQPGKEAGAVENHQFEPPRDYADGCNDQGCSNVDEEDLRGDGRASG